ncbi:hypothetical protein J056_002582 [Wallemia ichthyophaga EXF-994]|uniref:Uncharacterized protein n=1 Tax=Wallemia ichthyophaga (strain EXF-994 / CBS 113033) TaxID=1299270 RepID=R9AAC1_WALI9|nr:uncharacterized protein J056_002582 [Wallemia ichthyophaga EXF-994]EOQ99067.1 hypothetical protein J056_002582 [Wallemia ichthyophaga EXF-994]TIB34092.1 hypothetical protein E3P84_01933 [Wallemia ichthyophaga]TIB40822.1 hypothetical protein E3P83_02589 [Wallemia ichthyophaga]
MMDLFNIGSSTPPKPKPARQRVTRPTQPASLDSGYRYRYRQNGTGSGNLKSDGDQFGIGGNRRRVANLHHSSSPTSATTSKFSHAILSSSPLAPNDAADPKKRLWKERFKSQQLRKLSRARDVDSARINSKQLFNLDEEADEDDDDLQNKIDSKIDERDYRSEIRRKESKFDLCVGSDYDPLEFWSETEEEIPEDLDNNMDMSYFNDANATNAADSDDLFDDDELDALYDEYLSQNAQNAHNSNNTHNTHNAQQKEDTSMDMS